MSNNIHPVLCYRRRLFGFVVKCAIDVSRHILHELPAKADSEEFRAVTDTEDGQRGIDVEHAAGDYQTIDCTQVFVSNVAERQNEGETPTRRPRNFDGRRIQFQERRCR
ncbi:hypothetical protein GGE12_005479 [Rhizobium mongolense]|uniref:Uncharacterized protein n=1 Tax=Rhizobium mongolense TaxID=57676 RepID=A0A7W6WH64_9HYPH|nr:hypothetical protein [Rhizobium mongolense]